MTFGLSYKTKLNLDILILSAQSLPFHFAERTGLFETRSKFLNESVHFL
ncbi:hypothetical protein VCR3J2_250008 [Vibrio coralliirubri]|nr:hypothetical protein VCR3J2_250008 [Vibrio coralliirubri]CDT82387.1 hypothetical protein VCR8J2_220035 [Vibrio coralliirubri]